MAASRPQAIWGSRGLPLGIDPRGIDQEEVVGAGGRHGSGHLPESLLERVLRVGGLGEEV